MPIIVVLKLGCMPMQLQPCGVICLQLQEIKKNEDPRLSFCTPEFKEAQRTFTDAFKVRNWPI
jgi:hypothetical protein